MMTVKDVSRITGLSVRTLQYYDRIGLLSPVGYTEAGYRLYDEGCLERLQQIMLFRELEFPLKEIKEIVGSPAFDRDRALEQQIGLLNLKKEHLEGLISLAEGLRDSEVNGMDFKAFDKSRIEEYAERARESWGGTDAYREFEKKDEGRTPEEREAMAEEMMGIFAELGRIKDGPADSPEALALVGKLRDYITENFYNCTDEILRGLGAMYAAGGEFTENIDRAGGPGTGSFTFDAIKAYCG